jgi:uncharacterized protein YodC (DUF2158 family)
MPEIKVGETVRLKSGGPLMTVEKIESFQGVQKASCVWFDQNTAKEQWFTCSSLEAE